MACFDRGGLRQYGGGPRGAQDDKPRHGCGAHGRSRSGRSAGRRASRFPEIDCQTGLVALSSHPRRYVIDLGRIVSNRGLDIAPAQFSTHFFERHVEHSNALHARVRERDSYLCGSDEQLTLVWEQAICNRDPCICCATHFLKLTVDRG